MVSVCYPYESSFYPYHLIITLVITAIFVTIIFSYRQFLKVTYQTRQRLSAQGTKGTRATLLSQSDTIALGTLILGIVGTGFFPIIQSPLLDYSLEPESNNTSLKMNINNLGLSAANHVLASIIANNSDVHFSSFQSEPFLANHFRVNNTIGKVLFETDIMPPRSGIIINTKLNNAITAEKFIPYVRSDEKVGFHDTIITSIFYLMLGIAYVLLFVYLVYWSTLTGSQTWTPLHRRSKLKITL